MSWHLPHSLQSNSLIHRQALKICLSLSFFSLTTTPATHHLSTSSSHFKTDKMRAKWRKKRVRRLKRKRRKTRARSK
ncbi:hypothetical protein TWF694_006423 [Orbilia ellipsospora]|uniref:60S ribosomal protein L41 n=1 Tax=Orbilia ellipsospora TaxID=2528407 RepID=A0AAV9XK01_9PEZI